MSENKAKLPIDQVAPGMRLAEPIRNAAGVTLMPAGIRLAPMFISRLKKWNITEVTVLLDAKPETGPTTQLGSGPEPGTKAVGRPSTRAMAAAVGKEEDDFARDVMRDLNKRFANVQDNPLMVTLRDVAARKLISLGPDSYVNIVRQAVRAQEGEG